MMWHEVCIRSDRPPHNELPNTIWLHDRGKRIRIGRMIGREQALAMCSWDRNFHCGCEQFFQMHPDDAKELLGARNLQKPLWICRGFLEMD